MTKSEYTWCVTFSVKKVHQLSRLHNLLAAQHFNHRWHALRCGVSWTTPSNTSSEYPITAIDSIQFVVCLVEICWQTPLFLHTSERWALRADENCCSMCLVSDADFLSEDFWTDSLQGEYGVCVCRRRTRGDDLFFWCDVQKS
jgi:hypothetical protein